VCAELSINQIDKITYAISLTDRDRDRGKDRERGRDVEKGKDKDTERTKGRDRERHKDRVMCAGELVLFS